MPGRLFFVATSFGHIFLLPIIPLRSYVILQRHGDNFEGVSIGWSFKSIVTTWLRFVLGVLAMIALTYAVANHQQSRDWLPYVLAAGALVVFMLTYFLPWFRRATYERAHALAQRAELGEEIKIQIDLAYGVITQAEADKAFEALGEQRENEFLNPDNSE